MANGDRTTSSGSIVGSENQKQYINVNSASKEKSGGSSNINSMAMAKIMARTLRFASTSRRDRGASRHLLCLARLLARSAARCRAGAARVSKAPGSRRRSVEVSACAAHHARDARTGDNEIMKRQWRKTMAKNGVMAKKANINENQCK